MFSTVKCFQIQCLNPVMNTRKYIEPQNNVQAIMPFLYVLWQIKHLDLLKYCKNTRSN